MSDFQKAPADILERLTQLRAADAPTHGGRVLSYVYDSGLAELDELAAAAMRLVQPVNGLDPTTFTSVAVMEREVVAFARDMLGGDQNVVGSVTTGGTESCLLAVKSARDSWVAAGGQGIPRLLAPVSVHAAFQKAAHYFGLTLDLVPVLPTGQVEASSIIDRLGPDVALVVVSAPSYPHAALDPISDVAAAASAQGIACHVDACIGGWVLPFWPVELSPWDFRVPGVTSMSADLHKFGYAPKGASVLVQRGRDRQRMQYFATTRWAGYPVVNSTMLGSKSAGPLSAAWAIIEALGTPGFSALAESCARSTAALIEVVDSIEGLQVVGEPVGPLFAVAADETLAPELRVDAHHFADRVRAHGFVLQLQPGLMQSNGIYLPPTTHFTITPVTESVLAELSAALVAAAAEVRGIPAVRASDVFAALPESLVQGLTAPDAPPLNADMAFGVLGAIGLAPTHASDGGAGLPAQMAPLLALIEALPAPLTETLLTELLARLVEPRD
ncbi:MAG: pyridoxal phosphate-dependent decarboxylase family protein [Microbacteriaceae bacterium]